jgi:hypothetical protein
LHYPQAVSDLRVCGYGDMQLQVRVSSYSHVALVGCRAAVGRWKIVAWPKAGPTPSGQGLLLQLAHAGLRK